MASRKIGKRRDSNTLVDEHTSIHKNLQGTQKKDVKGKYFLKNITARFTISSLNFPTTKFSNFLFYTVVIN